MKLSELLEGLNLLEDTIKGGNADNSSSDEFDQDELQMGIKIEMEHTDDKDIAKEIAMDHLKEIPDYYTRLKKMEKDAKAMMESLKVNPNNEVTYSRQLSKFRKEKNVIDTHLSLETTVLKSEAAQYGGDVVYSAFKYDTKAIVDNSDEADNERDREEIYKNSAHKTTKEIQKEIAKAKEKRRKENEERNKNTKKPKDDTMTQILKAIKGQPSVYKFNDSDRQKLINDVAEFVNKRLVRTPKYSIDYIIYPKSTSGINKQLAHKLSELGNIPVMDDVLMKKKIGNNIDEVMNNLDNYIYKEKAMAELGEKEYAKMKRDIIREMNNTGTLEIAVKKVRNQYRKYLINLLQFEQDVEFLNGKNILVIDDILSTGKTMQDALELVRDAGARKAIGFTIFKY